MARRYQRVGLRTALGVRAGQLTGRQTLAARQIDVSARAMNRPIGNYHSSGAVNKDALAWSLYDQISTLKYLVIYLGAALSQCRLYVAEVDAVTGQPSGEANPRSKWGKVAADIVGDIAGGPTGQAELLSRTAAGLTLVGKFYLGVIHRRRGAPPEWMVLSEDEIERTLNGKTRVRSPEGEWVDFNPNTDTLQMIWRPHARIASQPDSLVLGSLGILTEIGLYTQVINMRSRNALLTNSVVGIPDNLSISTYRVPDVASSAIDPITGTSLSPSESGLGTLDEAEAKDLAEAVMMQAAAVHDDPTSFAASMPIFIQGPAEGLKGLTKLDLSTSFTDDLVKRRAEARVQFALDNDLPSTDLTGAEKINHWGAWLQSDERITMHVDPLMRVIVDGFTRIILRPLLAAAGMTNPDTLMIGYDTSQLTAKPNREDDSRKTFDRGGLSLSALRKYGSFEDEDGWQLDTSEGQRDFALWLVQRAPTSLSEPWITDALGLPPMPGMASVSSRTPAGASDPDSTSDTQSPPGGDGNPNGAGASSAVVRQLRSTRKAR